jgi:tetratricopeptide (TPR) repeat protein
MPAQKSSRRYALAVGALIAMIAAVLLGWWFFGANNNDSSRRDARGNVDAAVTSAPPAAVAPQFVGAETCRQCHAPEFEAWRGSDHDLAMQDATAATVLGNFDDARFTYNKVTSRFYRRGDQFFVNTDGPDGKLQDFRIRYVFGIRPLQQYLIEFPDGRMQALSIAWDTRQKEQGGQRWFHLYAGHAIDYRSPLHWTGRDQNWNYMCAECHSTNLRKNYDAPTDTFHTTWSEINVACEACHGPGSEHVKIAHSGAADKSSGLPVDFPKREAWIMNLATGTAQRAHPRTSTAEIETCAICHSRRAQIAEGYVPGHSLLDTHIPALLTEHLYEADGQMQDEVYNYGSFLQSKMFASGVTCSDCHEPHSLKLRAPGGAVCLQCHSPEKYAAPSHHHHVAQTEAISCPACHMPQRTYMGVDARHDHSFRVPRPDVSMQSGTPNACNDCHRDKSAEWAAHAIEAWFGPERKGLQHSAAAFHAARTGQLDAPRLLQQLASDTQQPAIVRATALAEMADYLTPQLANTLLPALNEKDGLLRLGALRGLANAPLQQRWNWFAPLLADPVRAVRVEAAGQLAGVPLEQMNDVQRARFDLAIDDYIAVQRTNAERPESHVNLGLLYAERGDAQAAEREYRAALKLAPFDVRASVNLADLYRALQRDAEGEALLHDALREHPKEASLYHALAMTAVRGGHMPEALKHLADAVKLAPEQALYTYLYAVALHDSGDRKKALQLLEGNLRRHPGDRDTLVALVSYYGESGEAAKAAEYDGMLRKLGQ